MKTSLLAALAVGCAISAQAQTATNPASSAASPHAMGDAVWESIGEESQHIAGYLRDHNKQGLLVLTPSTLKDLKSFIAKYPDDPHVPQAKFLVAQLSNLERQLGLSGAPSADAVSGEFNAIAADTSLPQSIRAQSGLMAVNALIQAADDESSPATYDKIEDKISAYQKQFGSATVNGKTSGTAMLREEQVTLLKSSKDTTRYHTLITRLANDSDADVAAMAKKAQADEQMMEGLKLKPVDLAFTALDGSAVDLAKLRGKVVLIDFWATWCPPCRDEIPGIVAAYRKYHGKGFEVVGISLDQDKAALTKYVADNKMPWPQYFDGKGWDNAISSRFGIQSIPAMWLLGKDGRLATQNGRDNLGSHVAKLLGAK